MNPDPQEMAALEEETLKEVLTEFLNENLAFRTEIVSKLSMGLPEESTIPFL